MNPASLNARLRVFVLLLLSIAPSRSIAGPAALDCFPHSHGARVVLRELDRGVEDALRSLRKSVSTSQYGDPSLHDNELGQKLSIALERQYFLIVPDSGELSVRLESAQRRDVSDTLVKILETVGREKLSRTELRIERIGRSRGHSLARLRLRLIGLGSISHSYALLSSCQIVVHFQHELHSRNLAPNDLPLLHVLNPGFSQFSSRSQDLSAAQNNALLSVGTSATPQASLTESVYLGTTRDGVAQIRGSEILALFPLWKGISTRALRLNCNGAEERLFVPNDSALNDNTILYFVGRRASTKDSWFSTFSRETAFFLSIDSTTAPLRYGLRPSNTTDPFIQSTNSFQHFEEDHSYVKSFSRGRDFQDLFWTPPTEGEMWTWKQFNRDIGFQHSTPFFALAGIGDSVDLRLRYEAINDFLAATPDKRVQAVVNGHLVYDETFDGCAVKDIRVRIPAQYFDAGLSTLSVVSLGSHTDVPNYSELQAFDSYELRARCSAHAINSCYGEAITTTTASRLQVSLFSAPEVICLDTIQHEAQHVSSTGVESFVLCARTGAEPWNSQLLNSRVASVSQEKGLYIAVRIPGVDTVLTWNGTSSDPEAAQVIQSVKDGALVALSSNDGRGFSVALQQVLSQNGSQKAATKASACYAAAFKKGSGQRFVEVVDSTRALLRDTLHSAEAECFNAVFSLSSADHYLVASSTDSIEHCTIRSAGSMDLRDTTLRADYLVITAPSLRQQAEDLAQYRKGQGHSVAVVDVNEIYRDFSFGQKTPEAIRDFLAYAYSHWSEPRIHDVLLVGDASYDNRQVAASSIMKDLIPAYGYPVSDVYYTLVDGNDRIQDFNIGRLPVQNPQQAATLIAKIKRYDSLPPDRWWKTFLFVAGGTDGDDPRDFLDYNLSFQQVIYTDDEMFRQRSICGDTVNAAMLYQLTVPGYSTSQHINSIVNGKGTSWINFVAHGSPQITDVNDWDAGSLANRDRPFVLATLSCQTAAFAEPQTNCIDENFLFADQQGAIAAMGATGYGIPSVQSMVMRNCFYQMALFGDRNFGDIFSHALSFVGQAQDSISMLVFDQCCLLGDPLSRIPFDTVARPVPLRSELRVLSPNGSPFISDDDDSAQVHITFFNAGVHADSLAVDIVHAFENERDTLHFMLYDLCMDNSLDFKVPVRSKNGSHSLIVHVLNSKAPENPRLPSTTELRFDVFAPRPLPIDPFPYWNVSAQAPRFRVVVPSQQSSEFFYQTQIRENGRIVDSLELQQTKNLQVHECFVEWKPEVRLQEAHHYVFAIRTMSKETQRLGAWLEIPFVACADSTAANVWIESDVEHDSIDFPHSASMRYDGSSGAARLVLNSEVSYALRSAVGHGFLDSLGHVQFQPDRALLMRLDGVTYGDRSDLRGFNIRLMNRRTGLVHTVRQFDSFVDRDTCDSCFNGSGRTLYRFLRDSISTDDYMFMALCDNVYGDVFVRRDLDSVKAVLKSMGCLLSDSLVAPHSYVLALSYADRRAIAEKMRMDTLTLHSFEDTVYVEGVVPVQPDSGYVESRSFGPARQWKSVQWHGNLSDSVCSKDLRVYGMSAAFATPELILSDTVAYVDLQKIDARRYPYIKVSIGMHRRGFSTDPSISSLRLDLVPLPDLAVIPSSIVVSPDSVLQGDTVTVSAECMRISPRAQTTSSSFVYKRTPISGGGVSSVKLVSIKDIDLDSPVVNADISSTLGFAQKTRNSYTINPDDNEPELYRFNNSISRDQVVTLDTWLPTLELDVDSMPVLGRMHVSRTPLIRCVLRDNSRMPILESWHLSGSINGVDTAIAHSADYVFVSSDQLANVQGLPPDARATLQFRPQLEIGVNRLTISGSDYFGNTRDTTFDLIVDRDVLVDVAHIVPNPFADYCMIHYHLTGPNSRERVILQIYDLRGEMVRSSELIARIGENSIAFDGTDTQGRMLEQGTYYYRIFVRENGSLDATHGMLVIVR